jgi:hypothetical protein
MTNNEIMRHNNDMCCELIQPEIQITEDGNLSCKLDYNYIETISMLSYHNRIFYEKNLIIKGSLILEDDNLYHVFFDPKIYYDNVAVKV